MEVKGTLKVPDASARVLYHFATRLGLGEHDDKNVKRVVCEWMARNAQATFRQSIMFSADYWGYVSSMTRERPHDIGKVIEGNKDLLGRFREALTVKLRQLVKAKIELHWIPRTGMFGEVISEHIVQEWQRLDTSLDPVLADIEKMLRTRTADLQRTMTNSQIEESRTAIQQAETVKRLTRLAFIFTPISATCSAFGMNVKEISRSQPPVWVSILVMFLVTSTSILFSLETMHNILWAMKHIIESRHMTSISSNLKTVWEKIMVAFAAKKGNISVSPWLPRHSTETSGIKPSWRRWFRDITMLLFGICRLPWIIVEVLAKVGAEYKKRCEDEQRNGQGEDDKEPKVTDRIRHQEQA